MNPPPVSRWKDLAAMASVATSLGYLICSGAGLSLMQSYANPGRWELSCAYAAICLSAFSFAVSILMTIRKSRLSYALEGTVQIAFCLIFSSLVMIGVIQDKAVDSTLAMKLIPLAASGLTAFLCLFSLARERQSAQGGGAA